jgi:hypothetical protein
MTDDVLAALNVLTERVAVLEAHRAAGDLMHRYAGALDDPDPERLSLLFTRTGILRTPSAEYRGRSAIGGFFAAARERDTSDKRHFVCQPEIEAHESGIVSLRCYFLYTALGSGRSALGWGTYAAECLTDSGTAQFESLTIAVHGDADLSAARRLGPENSGQLTR